tara:strand:- start:1683 stop:1946 length:264 start_codon:yes stop_codon:yes gene_type:complete
MKKICMYAVLLLVLFSSAQLVAAPVNVNRASLEQLVDNLEGIGAHKAQAIMDYREQHGDFRQLDDLLKVKGIGPSLIEKNQQDFLFQ